MVIRLFYACGTEKAFFSSRSEANASEFRENNEGMLLIVEYGSGSNDHMKFVNKTYISQCFFAYGELL